MKVTQSKHPLYLTWRNMINRCHKPNCPQYRYYGARGIEVCEKWRFDFWQFVADAPPKPDCRHSIDRINNDGHYEPGNIRWATQIEQYLNSRPALTLKEAAAETITA
jgi:hypothetical protein